MKPKHKKQNPLIKTTPNKYKILPETQEDAILL